MPSGQRMHGLPGGTDRRSNGSITVWFASDDKYRHWQTTTVIEPILTGRFGEPPQKLYSS